MPKRTLPLNLAKCRLHWGKNSCSGLLAHLAELNLGWAAWLPTVMHCNSIIFSSNFISLQGLRIFTKGFLRAGAVSLTSLGSPSTRNNCVHSDGDKKGGIQIFHLVFLLQWYTYNWVQKLTSSMSSLLSVSQVINLGIMTEVSTRKLCLLFVNVGGRILCLD